MYQPVSVTIKEHLNQGIVILPTESKITQINKLLIDQFFALDYRISNATLLSTDAESNVNGEVVASDDVSNYILGFALVRNINSLPELSSAKQATITRFKNKVLETVVQSIAHSSMRKNRGTRATYLERSYLSPEASTLNSIAVKPANPDDWALIPFVTSTTIFYNDFRANLGVGEKNYELENIQNDIQTRLKSNLDSARDKLNKRLAQPISDSLYGRIFLVSPKTVMEDKIIADLFDYVDKRIIRPAKNTLVDTPDDDSIIPIPA